VRATSLVALGLTTICCVLPATASAASSGGASASDTAQPPAATTPAPPAATTPPASDAPAAPTDPATPAPPPASPGAAAFGVLPTVPGTKGVIRAGIAYAPANAPTAVKEAVWAANTLLGKPYIWGGGHASFRAAGYDCSGTVSFALHAAGLLKTPEDSSDLMSWGKKGKGAWITVYTNPGHAFAMIAGMRLDTAGPGLSGPRWRTAKPSTRGFSARHPLGF